MSAKRFAAVALALQLLFLSAPAHVARADDPADAGPVQQTPLGPITAQDKDLLVKVRLAGLWEMPMGEEAQTRAASRRVKEVGQQLASDHEFLDERVVRLASQMGVELPSEANADQQSWMAEMRSRTGAAFDDSFANRLRAAHGAIFPVVGTVRANTRNEAIRQFAQICNQIVLKHMTLLESTNAVTEAGLSKPVAAGAPNPADRAAVAADPVRAARVVPTDNPSPLVVLLICLAGVVVTIGVLRLLRPRGDVR
jgi:predicted outer membrane protein